MTLRQRALQGLGAGFTPRLAALQGFGVAEVAIAPQAGSQPGSGSGGGGQISQGDWLRRFQRQAIEADQAPAPEPADADGLAPERRTARRRRRERELLLMLG